MRECTACKIPKEQDEFYKYKPTQCIPCVRKINRERYQNARNRIVQVTVQPTENGFRVLTKPTFYLAGSSKVKMHTIIPVNTFAYRFYCLDLEDYSPLIEEAKLEAHYAVNQKITQLKKMLTWAL